MKACYFCIGLCAGLIVNPKGKKVAVWLSLHSLTTPWCSRGPSWVLGEERELPTGCLNRIWLWTSAVFVNLMRISADCEPNPVCPPCSLFHLLCPPLLLPLHCNLSPARNLPSSLRKESVTLISSLKSFPGLGGGYKTWCSLLEGKLSWNVL